jgi:uncharacterized protein YigE (DUF2233 family)
MALAARALAVEFSEEQIAGKQITVCRVNVRKEKLQLFLRDEHGVVWKRFDRLSTAVKKRGQKLVFAMNAGMYHMSNGDLPPVGLFISDGLEVGPLNLAEGYGNFFLKPNGVLAVTESGARVVETSQYPLLREKVLLATQSGPLLVLNGKIHPAFIAASTSRLFRNGVGVAAADTAIFAISEAPVNFYEFATFFRDVLHCPNALFLDGTVSSLHAPKLGRSDFKIDLGPIIGVTEGAETR